MAETSRLEREPRCGTCEYARPYTEHYSTCTWPSSGKRYPFWARGERHVHNTAHGGDCAAYEKRLERPRGLD